MKAALSSLYKTALEPLEHCFWKMQIDILRACPPLFGVVSSVSLGADKSMNVWMKTLLRAGMQMPRALFIHWRNRREDRVALPRITVVITTRCTLRCDKCLAHIPDLKCGRDMPTDALVDDIRALLACVDIIYDVNLSGGEAFLHPELDKIIRAFADSGKVENINLTTNGTIMPGMKVLAALRDTQMVVKISRYPSSLQPEADALKSIFKDNGIRYTHESGAFWRNPEGLAFRRSMAGLGRVGDGAERRRFSVCLQQLGFPYMNGKLYRCCESALVAEEWPALACEEDCIDLRATKPNMFPAQLEKLLNKRTVSACACCHGYTYKTPKVPVAGQRQAGKHDVLEEMHST